MDDVNKRIEEELELEKNLDHTTPEAPDYNSKDDLIAEAIGDLQLELLQQITEVLRSGDAEQLNMLVYTYKTIIFEE